MLANILLQVVFSRSKLIKSFFKILVNFFGRLQTAARTPAHPSARPPARPSACPFTRSLAHPTARSSVRSLARPITRPPTRPFARPPIHPGVPRFAYHRVGNNAHTGPALIMTHNNFPVEIPSPCEVRQPSIRARVPPTRYPLTRPPAHPRHLKESPQGNV